MLSLVNKKLLGVSVTVGLYRNDNLMCITNLPLTTAEQDLRGIVEPLGPIEKCFLMRGADGKHCTFNSIKIH